ncbi:MAG: hypothetical protein AABY87_12765 [bacterium]
MKKKARKKNSKSARREFCSYYIEILDWDLSYSLRLTGDMKNMPWPFWEHASLDITGKFLQPNVLEGRAIEVTILGSRTIVRIMEHPEECSEEPKALGGLRVRGKQSKFIGSVPLDVLHTLCFLIQAGKIKALVLSGQILYHGSAAITSICFEKDYEPED